MPHYDGDDEEERSKDVIVNHVEVKSTKEIPSSSNDAHPKLKGTSKELSVRQQTSPGVRVECSRESTPLQSNIHVTSMAEVIPNADRTLMGEIQHAVVNIIPDSENMQEGNLETAKVDEVSESVVQ